MAHRLADSNVKRLLLKLSIPAVTGMFVMALYNLVDTIFVGRGVGTLGIAGLSIVFPIQMVVLSFGLLHGIGAASVISRFLGAGREREAENAYGNAVVSALSTGVLLSLVGTFCQDRILSLFGASADILPVAREYYRIIILGSPFFVAAMTGNNVLRSVGMARSAMTTMITGAVLNIILDPIFIFVLDMGVKGVATATVISQIVANCYMISELRPSRSGLRLHRGSLRIRPGLILKMESIGISSFIRHIAASFVVALVNGKLMEYGDSVSVAAYGMTMRLARFLIMPLIGIAQGLQPIVGYNFGAGNMDRVRTACRTGLGWAAAISVSGFLVVQTIPDLLTSMFTDDPELLEAGSQSMRILMLGLWAVGFQIVGTSMFQALGRVAESLLLSLSREVLFFIPALLLLSANYGVKGVWYTAPLADVLAFTVTLVLVAFQWRRFRQDGRG